MYGERSAQDRMAVFRRFAREATQIRMQMLQAVAMHQAGDARQADLLVRHAFLKLNDRWSSFCRRLLFASALGGPGFAGNTPAAPNVTTADDVLQTLGIVVPWKDDPAWHVPDMFLSKARRLRVYNLTTLNGSIGATPNPTEQIRFVRNYFAHANPHTFSRAESTCSGARPVEFCLNAKTAGEMTMVAWLDELLLIGRAASE